MIYDGHVHTPFCPHGTSDSLESYAARALELGYSGLTFTEHAPLPEGFRDPVPEKDSAMSLEKLPEYIEAVQKIKLKFKNRLDIRIGLEVDYIEGFEKETASFLQKYGPLLDDSILSVHFLKVGQRFFCLDYSLAGFEALLAAMGGSVEQLYLRYFQTVKMSALAELGAYKPSRLGHITLPAKYQQVYSAPSAADPSFLELITIISKNKMAIDYNGAGVNKTYGGTPYPFNRYALEVIKMGIPLVYGSDAHQAADLGQGYEQLIDPQRLAVPF